MTQQEVTTIVTNQIILKKNEYYRLAISFCKNNDDAMDAISEMTIIACVKYKSLRKIEALDAWCKTILVNCCRKYLRQKKKTIPYNELKCAITDSVKNCELSLDLEKVLSNIKPIFREVIILIDLLDFTYSESAKVLHIPIGTVKSRRNKGIKLLNKLLEGYNNEN